MSIAPVSLITPLFVCRTEQQQYLCYYFEYCCLNVDSSRGRIFTLDIGSGQLSTQAHLETYYKVSVTQQQAEQPTPLPLRAFKLQTSQAMRMYVNIGEQYADGQHRCQ